MTNMVDLKFTSLFRGNSKDHFTVTKIPRASIAEYKISYPPFTRDRYQIFCHDNKTYIPYIDLDLSPYSTKGISLVKYCLKDNTWSAIVCESEHQFDTSTSFTQYNNNLYAFDSRFISVMSFTDFTWRLIGDPLESARSNVNMTACNNKLFILGGEPKGKQGWQKDIAWFDLTTKKWNSKELPILCAYGYAICSYKDSVYAFGGGITSCMESNQVKIFNTQNNSMDVYEPEETNPNAPKMTFFEFAGIFTIKNMVCALVISCHEPDMYLFDIEKGVYSGVIRNKYKEKYDNHLARHGRDGSEIYKLVFSFNDDKEDEVEITLGKTHISDNSGDQVFPVHKKF